MELDDEEYDDVEIEEEGENEENESYVVFIPRSEWHKPFVVEAKKKELQNFIDFGAYKRVPDKGQKFVSCGWIVTEKIWGDVVGCKARLVVHGNQIEEPVETDSPTVRKL